MNKKILVSTWCTDDYSELLGVEKLANSLKYFHPEVDHVIFDSKMTQEVYEKYSWMKPIWMMPPSCIPFIEEYDMVVHLDADAVVTGPMDEFFNSSADVVGVRNNNSFNKAGSHNGITIHHLSPFGNNELIPVQGFINAGLVGVNRKEFWYDWHNLNKESARIKTEVNPYAHGIGDENDTLNQLFHWNRYNSEIIDPIGSKISYGLSNCWGEDHYNHWESWKNLYVQDEQLCIDDPVNGDRMVVKVLHQAGGSMAAELNRSSGGFRKWFRTAVSEEALDYIDKITK
jgi:hypothetical protein